jgi:hypothetical protein
MPGLVPAIHVFLALSADARHKAGHDELHSRMQFANSNDG